MHRVFVYGTLKRGYENHRLLADATFLGKASTLDVYRMLDGSFPVLRDVGPDRFPVSGELYDVDNETLGNLDELEGVAEGMYDRIEIDVILRSWFGLMPRKSRAFVYIGCGAYWDHQSKVSYVTLDRYGHIDWTASMRNKPKPK